MVNVLSSWFHGHGGAAVEQARSHSGHDCHLASMVHSQSILRIVNPHGLASHGGAFLQVMKTSRVCVQILSSIRAEVASLHYSIDHSANTGVERPGLRIYNSVRLRACV